MVNQFYKLTPNSTPRKSQMTKVIHSDFLTVAEAMTSAFSLASELRLFCTFSREN